MSKELLHDLWVMGVIITALSQNTKQFIFGVGLMVAWLIFTIKK